MPCPYDGKVKVKVKVKVRVRVRVRVKDARLKEEAGGCYTINDLI
jgi:hypothetical protein